MWKCTVTERFSKVFLKQNEILDKLSVWAPNFMPFWDGKLNSIVGMFIGVYLVPFEICGFTSDEQIWMGGRRAYVWKYNT